MHKMDEQCRSIMENPMVLFESLENLELHLKTCEKYECEECEFTSKQISGIKKHILETESVPITFFI